MCDLLKALTQHLPEWTEKDHEDLIEASHCPVTPLRDVIQSFHPGSGIVPRIRPRLIPSTFSPFNNTKLRNLIH
jgi:hypothetical protein